MIDLKVLDAAGNFVVAKDSCREFPGILIQGDTLNSLLEDICEVDEALVRQDIGEAKEIVLVLKERIESIISYYERVLSTHQIETPYVK